MNGDLLNIGDRSVDGQIEIVDKDRLCYIVRNTSRGATGLRTISISILNEFVDYLVNNPDCTAIEAREALSGQSQLDKFEYGYCSTLHSMAKMIVGQIPIISQSSYVQHHPNRYTPTAQTIYYGCPGTGKSFDVMEIAEGKYGEKVIWYSNVPDEEGNYHRVLNPSEKEKEKLTCNVFRTTFHPDYDYATFVGCYKPVKENDKLDYRFIPQVFTNAYVSALHHPEDPTYLIIEEINRGNCAQIFGDLFQLLDRTDGVSRYPIKPDTELSKYLASQGIPSENLKLPANLHLYATMNTSDQSLFPMDSAFKRRWAMEYKPIDYKHKIAKDYTITIGEDTNPNKEVYPWLKFLLMVNELIINATDSEDKQMGEFFIKSSISEKEFKNKVMFFIWNDVCKDYYNPRRVSPLFFMKIAHPKDNEKNYFTFAELFGPRNKDSRLLLEFILFLEQSYKERHPETVLNDKGRINWEETDKLDFTPQTSDKADSE